MPAFRWAPLWESASARAVAWESESGLVPAAVEAPALVQEPASVWVSARAAAELALVLALVLASVLASAAAVA